VTNIRAASADSEMSSVPNDAFVDDAHEEMTRVEGVD